MGYATRSKSNPPPAKSLEKKKPAPVAQVKAAKPVEKAAPSAPRSTSDFPDVPVLNEKGEEVMSRSICADTNVVVFLYPKANTPGCTKQACGLNDNFAELQAAGFAVVGLSYDSPTSQSKWASKYSLKFSFLCDTKDGGLIKKLGCSKPPKSIKRSHFVVAKGGKILDAQIQISPGDSIAKAVSFVQNYNAEEGAGDAKADVEVSEKEEAEGAGAGEGDTKQEDGEAAEEEKQN